MRDFGNRVAVGATSVLFFLALALSGAAADVGTALQLRLDTELQTSTSRFDATPLAVREFYEQRAFAPAWVESGAAGAKAALLVDTFATADKHGLAPSDYRVDDLRARLSTTEPDSLAELELSLTAALLRYGRDVSAGRVEPHKVDRELFLEPEKIEPVALLTAAATAPDLAAYLATLPPATPQYERLQQALADYRAAAAAGGWTKVPAGETLKPGMTDPRIATLRARLIETADLAADQAASQTLDPTLEEAIKNFQYRHGLTPDGAVGKNTLAALNTPVETRIEQMLINMERRRWMPDDLGDYYVFVNMADFELKVVKGPKTVHVTRVVVGKPYHRTPVFSKDMKYVVVNPYWHITPAIARNEMLPKIRKNPNYFRKQRIRVFSSWGADARELDPATIDWQTVPRKGFPYKLRQDSGDGNALGRIKFMLPNRHNIYLHDTPSKSLFKRTVRSFSHGCIRVENPLDFAEVILGERAGMDRAAIDAAVAARERKIVNLSAPIPVHITYLTSWANKDGSVHFRDDIYGRDKRLAGALKRSRTASN